MSKAEEIPSSFISFPELCRPSVTKVNITAVLFEAARINSPPQDIIMITAEVKSSYPAARHQITRNGEKKEGLTLTSLFNDMEIENSHFSSAALNLLPYLSSIIP